MRWQAHLPSDGKGGPREDGEELTARMVSHANTVITIVEYPITVLHRHGMRLEYKFPFPPNVECS